MTTKQEPEEILEDDVETAQSDDVENPEIEPDEPQQDDKPDTADSETTDWKMQARKWERRTSVDEC